MVPLRKKGTRERIRIAKGEKSRKFLDQKTDGRKIVSEMRIIWIKDEEIPEAICRVDKTNLVQCTSKQRSMAKRIESGAHAPKRRTYFFFLFF